MHPLILLGWIRPNVQLWLTLEGRAFPYFLFFLFHVSFFKDLKKKYGPFLSSFLNLLQYGFLLGASVENPAHGKGHEEEV